MDIREQIEKVAADTEKLLEEDILEADKLRDIDYKVSHIIAEMNPPRYFKRLA